MCERFNKIFGNVDARKFFKETLNELSNKCFDYSVTLRGIYLSNMFFLDKEGFFDTPSIDILLNSIYSESQPLFYDFSPSFSQTFTNKVSKIQQNPLKFAEYTVDFFQNDVSQLMHFSYSLFPTIFGYFLTNEFLTSAELFLGYIIDNGPKLLAFELVNSLFLSATLFYDRFWTKLSISFSTPKMSLVRIIYAFTDALNQVSTIISPQYCRIITKLIGKYGDEANCFIIKQMFLEPFMIQATSSPLFHESENTKNFEMYLNNLCSGNSEELSDIVELILNEKNHSIAPSIGELTYETPIKLLFCEKDIRIFFEIYEGKDNDFKFIPYKKLEDNISPYVVELFPFVKSKDETKIFGINIEYDLPEEENIECTRIWNTTYEYSVENNIPLYKAVDYMRERFPDFKDFLTNKLLQKYKKLNDLLETTIKYKGNIQNIETFLCTAKTAISVIIYKISHNIMNDIINSSKEPYIINRINKSIRTVIGGIRVPSNIELTITCCALDCIVVTQKEKAKILDEEFKDILIEWSFKKKKVDVLLTSLMTSLYDISLMGYGKRLKKILEFMNQFEAVNGCEMNDEWHNKFRAIMSSISDSGIFTSFMFLNYFMFIETRKQDILTNEDGKTWIRFSSGILEICQDHDEFLSLISDPTINNELFSVMGKKIAPFPEII